MKTIEELTPEQMKLFDEVSNKYLNIAFGGNQEVNLEAAKDGFNLLYSRAGYPPPKDIVVLESPKELKKESGLVDGETFNPVGIFYDAPWTSLADFFQQISASISSEIEFDVWKNFICFSGVAFCVLREQVAYVCRRPKKTHFSSEGKLHSEKETVISWEDGFGEYALNGVVVSKEVALTPGEKMPLSMLREANVDVRREIVRKMGIERIAYLGKQEVLDTLEDYQLILLDIGDGRKREYLKMKNPSIGVTHIEGVLPGLKTAVEALNWRNQQNTLPEILT